MIAQKERLCINRMNLYFHRFRTVTFSRGKSFMPFGRWVWDKPMMVAPLLAVDLKACHKAGSGYRVVTSIDDLGSVPRLTTMQANLLAVVVRSLLAGSNWYDSGRLV